MKLPSCGSCSGFLSWNESSTNCVSSCTRPWLVRRRTTSPNCSSCHQQHSIMLFTAQLQQWRPLPTNNRVVNWWPCILCRRTSCMESPTNRQNWNSCDHWQQHSGAILSPFFFAQHTHYVMHLRADCKRRTTNCAVTVSVLLQWQQAAAFLCMFTSHKHQQMSQTYILQATCILQQSKWCQWQFTSDWFN